MYTTIKQYVAYSRQKLSSCEMAAQCRTSQIVVFEWRDIAYNCQRLDSLGLIFNFIADGSLWI